MNTGLSIFKLSDLMGLRPSCSPGAKRELDRIILMAVFVELAEAGADMPRPVYMPREIHFIEEYGMVQKLSRGVLCF